MGRNRNWSTESRSSGADQARRVGSEGISCFSALARKVGKGSGGAGGTPAATLVSATNRGSACCVAEPEGGQGCRSGATDASLAAKLGRGPGFLSPAIQRVRHWPLARPQSLSDGLHLRLCPRYMNRRQHFNKISRRFVDI